VFIVVISYVNVASELRDRLVEELGDRIEAIVLYGSVAKNTAHEESDIDVLVVTRGDDRSLCDKVSEIRTEIDLKNYALTALVHVTGEELERYAKLGSPFVKSVAEEGVILYDSGILKKLRGSLLGKG